MHKGDHENVYCTSKTRKVLLTGRCFARAAIVTDNAMETGARPAPPFRYLYIDHFGPLGITTSAIVWIKINILPSGLGFGLLLVTIFPLQRDLLSSASNSLSENSIGIPRCYPPFPSSCIQGTYGTRVFWKPLISEYLWSLVWAQGSTS